MASVRTIRCFFEPKFITISISSHVRRVDAAHYRQLSSIVNSKPNARDHDPIFVTEYSR